MKILAIQNRMGIGDMVIFLPFIEAIAKKFSTPVSILAKENSKASQFLNNNKNINEIITLDRDNKSRNGRHDGLIGSLKLIADLKKYNFEKIFIFNSSIENTKNKYNISSDQINILLGIGGSGPTKRIPAYKFLNFMKMSTKEHACKFFLATGTNEEEQIILNEILNSEFKEKCVSLDKIKIKETLPIIKNCTVAICNDSSFSHLSAALDIPTIVLLSDTPLMYGSYSPNMYPIIPDGEEIVTHDTLGKERINSEKIFKIFKEIVT